MMKKKPTRKTAIVPFTVVCSGTRLFDVTREVKTYDKKKRRSSTVVETPYQYITHEPFAHFLARRFNQELGV